MLMIIMLVASAVGFQYLKRYIVRILRPYFAHQGGKIVHRLIERLRQSFVMYSSTERACSMATGESPPVFRVYLLKSLVGFAVPCRISALPAALPPCHRFNVAGFQLQHSP